MANYNFQGKIILKGKIRAITGIHIGGNKTSLDIGGIDNSFIRTRKGRLYIPGSSLRGKIRSLLEKYYNYLSENGEPSSEENDVTKIFGIHKSKDTNNVFPTTLLVRDAYLSDEQDISSVLEIKTENVINRISGKAEHPREIERVSGGSTFDFEIVFNLHYDKDENKKLFEVFLRGMKLLEDDYLGGSGSRGYGKIKFENIELIKRDKSFYEGKMDQKKLSYKDLQDLKDDLENIFS
ncbi:MAG: type III-A CRISPR-associated RAMP protein Csm3 [Caldisericum sp.]|uniref:type III-A CRISPR-associated RAMP protein Csm3 n=1 Tax=Caldisericum sp. TaxID=2499687 RepID=UPI003D0AACF1